MYIFSAILHFELSNGKFERALFLLKSLQVEEKERAKIEDNQKRLEDFVKVTNSLPYLLVLLSQVWPTWPKAEACFMTVLRSVSYTHLTLPTTPYV